MTYVEKTVRSKPGLSQEDALASLQDNPLFKPGSKIASIRHRENRWIARILEPKTAEFPPSDDGGEEESPAPPKSEGEDKGESPDSPPSDDDGDDSGFPGGDEGGDGEKKEKGGEKGEIKALLGLVQQIADALGIAPPDPGMGGPDDMGPGLGGPDGPPGPPDHGGPAGGPPGSAGKNPGQLPTKLQPGEVLPHQTPVGAPAFASTKQANPMAMTPGVATPNAPVPAGNAACPTCGGPTINGHCPACAGGTAGRNPGGTPGAGPVGAGAPPVMAKRVASFTASLLDAERQITIKEAKANLDATYGPQGFKVKQIKRNGPHISALLSVR